MKATFKGGVALGAMAVALASSAAFAQSTGTTEVEELVVTGRRGPASVDGMIVATLTTKSRSTLTQEFITTQQPGQSILQTVNLMPAVNFTNNDSYGSSGGDIVIRGFDGQRISLNVDGIQLNDTGNYAIFSNQQLDPELIEQVSVNLGTTDVDSPTASATGGTINYVTIKPAPEFGGFVQPSYGSDDYKRIFGIIHTGDWNGFGAWAAASYTSYDKFRGPGEMEKTQLNFRVYKAFENGDFVSLSGHYNQNRNNFYRRVNVDNFNNGIIDPENFDVCTRDAPTAGVADNDGSGSAIDPNTPAGCINYFNLQINPSNTGNLRGQSRFTLADNLTLTVDPVFQYVLANGGGSTVMAENDPRLQGSDFNPAAPTASGVDLNGDGDILDRIRLFSPNNTNTHRYTLNTSLIWDVTETNRLRLAYVYDYGRHKQTGAFGFLSANGDPESVFGGKEGEPVLTLDGDTLQRRNRFSIAELHQISFEYVGRFFDDNLIVSAGLRAPFFHRDLNNFCFQEDTFNAYCAPELTEAQVQTIRARDVGPPVSFERDYSRVLPNVGATWRITPEQQVYANYSENLSAPRTDDLYDRIPADPDPETSRQFDVGYRFQSGRLIAAASAYYSTFQNYIVRATTTDEATGETIATSINVGGVNRWGADGQIGFRPTDALSLYATASFIQTEVKEDIPDVIAGVFLLTSGNELPEVPQWMFGGRAEYEIAGFTIGLQGKWVDQRFTNVLNDEKTPSYAVVDADIRYDLGRHGWEGTFIQVNVQNILDETYLADISTDLKGDRTANIGAPRAASITLRAAF